jgi:diguanylate cyclase (GGDEF)-like protein
MKKWITIPIAILFVVYFIAIVEQNNIVGDLLSPILTFLAFAPVFYAFFWKEQHKLLKISGLFYALAIFARFLCDFSWGFSTLILNVNPENNLLITYGYSLTNLFLLLSLILLGYFQVRNWNKMQVFLDTAMVAISIMVIVWVFVFEQNTAKAEVLLSDPVSMSSLIMDFIIYAWTNICFFSTRKQKEPLFIKFSEAGGVVFVVIDIIYYYEYFYRSYEPNSLLDGGYVIAFALMGISGLMKIKLINQEDKNQTGAQIDKEQFSFKHIKKELLFLIVPILLFVFRGIEAPSLLFLITAIMFYFIFTNFTQNSIFRDKILEREKEYISELENRVEERTQEITKVMNTDVITGLKNRRYLEEYLEKEIRTIDRDEKIYLLYIDQNKYKSVKSIYGKYMAERALEEIGKRIEKIVKEKNGLVTSYGEDIFVAIFKSTEDYEEALRIAEKVINFCSDNYLVENYIISVTLNIGVACYPCDSKNMEELIRNADTAMMQARKTGFNVIQKYDKQIGIYINKRDRIELKLKKVIYDEEFSLQFQPQVNCNDGSIYGVEALIRWFTKKGDYIPPMDFIPITEENGMIISLGYWIMEQAAKQLSSWKKLYASKIKMAINASSKQLIEENFTDKLIQILENYQIPKQDFEIEITESIQLETNSMIHETLAKLSSYGISIAIDDFGTGYSSLYYIRELPVNRIKIAKELIDNIDHDIYAKSIVQMVISVAKVNNIKVIAEGVETKEQWECLKEMECNEIQGYLFSKPLVPNELEKNWFGNNE